MMQIIVFTTADKPVTNFCCTPCNKNNVFPLPNKLLTDSGSYPCTKTFLQSNRNFSCREV